MIKRIRYFVEGIIITTTLGFMGILPFKWASTIGGFIGRKIGPFLTISKIARKNLHKAMPNLTKPQIETVVKEMWDNLGRTVCEFRHIAKMNEQKHDQITKLEGQENLPLNSKQRVIFISGHFANWEMAPKTIALKWQPLALVYRAANNKYVDNFINKNRNRYQTTSFPKGAKGARQLITALKAGQHLGMLLDQKMNNGIAVPFFGIDAMTAPAIAQLALKFDCTLIPVQVIRENNSCFKVIIHKPLTYKKTKNRQHNIFNAMQQINLVFENWIKQHPEQWFWVHKRWPHSKID